MGQGGGRVGEKGCHTCLGHVRGGGGGGMGERGHAIIPTSFGSYPPVWDDGGGGGGGGVWGKGVMPSYLPVLGPGVRGGGRVEGKRVIFASLGPMDWGGGGGWRGR